MASMTSFYSIEKAAEALYAGDKGSHIVPSLVGTWLSWLAQGAVFVQFWWWWKYSSKTDPLGTQCLVYSQVLVVTADSLFLGARLMYQNVLNFGLYARFVNLNWQTVPYLFQILTRVPTTSYLIHRTWILSESITILVINILLSLGFLASYLWDYIGLHLRAPTSPVNYTPSFIWGAFKVVGSAFISATMMWYFLRSRTGWQSTDQLLTKLSLLVVQTQLPPTTIALIFIALTIANIPNGPSNYAYIFLCEPHILVISILVLLNSRQKLGKIQSEHSRSTRSMEPPTFQLQRLNKNALGAGNIRVTTETECRDDEGRSILPVMDKTEI